jgi:bifunctional non-homologous end joining protein LigD
MTKDSRTIEVSNPDKVFFPGEDIRKGEVVDYYRRVAEVMLPHLADRPLSMHRFPDGLSGESFFQKKAPDYFPDWVRRVTVPKEGGRVTHVVCDDAPTLVYLADQACLTPHVWLSRADRPDHPDRLVFDLDPPAGGVAETRSAARATGDLLGELGLDCFVMTTGSRGYHLMVPLDRRATFDTVRGFAHRVAQLLVARDPERLTTEHRKNRRGPRVFLDYFRNGYAQTTVAPYSLRAGSGAPVATPIDWEELGGTDPQSYTIRNLFRRLAQKHDPWERLPNGASLTEPARRLDALLHA